MLSSAHEFVGSVSTRWYLIAGVCLVLLALLYTDFWKAPEGVSSAQFGLLGGLGNVLAYSKDPVGYLRTATIRYGNIFRVNLILASTIWLRGGEMNKMYLDTKEDMWSFGDGMVSVALTSGIAWWPGLFLNKIVKPGYFNHLRTFVGSLNRGVNRGSTLDHFSHLIQNEVDSNVASWCQKSDIHLFESVSKLVHKIIVQCLMGPDFYQNHVDELYDLLHRMEDDIGNMLNFVLPDWMPHPPAVRLHAARDRLYQIFEDRLEERFKDPEQWIDAKDYISYTLGDPSTAHLKEFFASHHTLLMFAAHTSTVASISWTILELLKSPDRLQSLRQDLSQHSDPRESRYLDALLKETGRLYSGVNMLRLARQDRVIAGSGTSLPRGSVVSISPYLTHRDPDIWEFPDEWYPERWLQDENLLKRLNDRQIRYMPFGAGNHKCPGEKLALTITSKVITAVTQDTSVDWGKSGQSQDTTGLDFSKMGSPWLTGDVLVRFSHRTAKK